MNTVINTAQKLILVKDLSNLIDFSLIEKKFSKLTFHPNYLNDISKEKNIFDDNEFSHIKTILEMECKAYLDSVIGIKNLYDDLKITNSWGNITRGGQAHHEHIHPFSVVSGIIFLDNNVSNLQLTIHGYVPDIPHFIPNRLIKLRMHDLLMQAGENPNRTNNLQKHLILFLSNCPHEVQPTPAESGLRRTISFNTFWKGEVGKSSPDLGTIIF